MREETERTYRQGRVALYKQLAKLMEEVAKVNLEIAEVEYEMRTHGLKVSRPKWRPMVEVDVTTGELVLKD